MTRETRTGRIDEHLNVHNQLTVHGHVNGGATVWPGGHLTVNGNFEGPATTHEGGSMSVHGYFQGEVVDNEGIIMVAGMITSVAVECSRVAVAVGSVIETPTGRRVVGEGGALIHPRDAPQDHNIDAGKASNFCIWVPDEGRLVAIDELPDLAAGDDGDSGP